jgi:branched-chain amino acid transport system ATP-binding protein
MSAVNGAGRPAEETVLELRGIDGGYGRTRVLHDVSLAVPRSSVVALLGANGAGKTTLLRVASGLLRPTAGQVLLAGSDVTRQSAAQRARRGLCLIPEGRGVFRSLTVRDNLELAIPAGAKRTARLERPLTAFPALARRLNQVAGNLSGGEQQMLALSRAYLTEPAVVLLDELSMGLAPILVDQVFASIRQLAEDGIALILVEQYVNRGLELADRVCLINRGRITFSGPPGNLDSGALIRNYLGSDPLNASPAPSAEAATGDPQSAGREV